MEIEALGNCTVCRQASLRTMLDFGDQPPANRFISQSSGNFKQEKYALALGYCQECTTIQLTKRMPIKAIQPQYKWLVYNEPEGHLDQVAIALSTLPAINKQSTLLGITYKDQSTIDRLSRMGFMNGQCIDESLFLKMEKGFIGLETIQQLLLNPDLINTIKEKYGKVDILIMRHVIEHSNDAAALIKSLRSLINDTGYLVMELPDSQKIIESNNHAFIWEEHISYFTEQSLHVLSNHVGAKIAWFNRYVYPYEDSLLVALQFYQNNSDNKLNEKISLDVKNQLNQFSESLIMTQVQWKEKLEAYKKNNEKIAIFGAGHLAAKFINFHGISHFIDCVIDDNPNKKAMLMPGSLLPIVPSSELLSRNIKVCISTLSPESEAKVRLKLSDYFDKGGIFLTAFSSI